MAHITLRVSEEEKQWIESYAQVNGVSLSNALRQAIFEKMEDEYDLKMVAEFEKEKDFMHFYSHEEMKSILGID